MNKKKAVTANPIDHSRKVSGLTPVCRLFIVRENFCIKTIINQVCITKMMKVFEMTSVLTFFIIPPAFFLQFPIPFLFPLNEFLVQILNKVYLL